MGSALNSLRQTGGHSHFILLVPIDLVCISGACRFIAIDISMRRIVSGYYQGTQIINSFFHVVSPVEKSPVNGGNFTVSNRLGDVNIRFFGET